MKFSHDMPKSPGGNIPQLRTNGADCSSQVRDFERLKHWRFGVKIRDWDLPISNNGNKETTTN